MKYETNECWTWTAGRDRGGYGVFRIGAEWPERAGQKVGAHRFMWEVMKGSVPSGLELDHLCRNRACVNPAHLEPVTHAENARRGIGGETSAARQKAKTQCPHGHPYDETNTYQHKGMRFCRTCAKERARRRTEENAAFRRREKELNMTQIVQGVNPVRSSAGQLVKLYGDLAGKGAVAPVVSATTVLGARDNFGTTRQNNATTFVRNGTGDYTITWPAAPPSAAKVMDISVTARGTTAGIQATLVSWAVTSGQLVTQIKCFIANGTATDLADGVDFVRFAFEFDLSNA